MEKIGAAQFDEKLKSSQFVIMDFGSPGCAPCKRIPPLVNEIITEMSDTDISAYEIDITEDPDIAQKMFVMGVPTIIVFKDGKEVKRFNSVPKKDKIKKVLN